MDVLLAVRTVLAVREYRNDPIPDDVVSRILEAGRLSASARNRQPWHFVVVDNRDLLNRLTELAPTGTYISGAALAVVVAIEDTPWSTSDASRAIQNMVLTAWSEGVGSNLVGIKEPEEVGNLLGLPPNLTAMTILPFGYPTKAIGKGIKSRKALSEVASHNQYGQPDDSSKSG